MTTVEQKYPTLAGNGLSNYTIYVPTAPIMAHDGVLEYDEPARHKCDASTDTELDHKIDKIEKKLGKKLRRDSTIEQKSSCCSSLKCSMCDCTQVRCSSCICHKAVGKKIPTHYTYITLNILLIYLSTAIAISIHTAIIHRIMNNNIEDYYYETSYVHQGRQWVLLGLVGIAGGSTAFFSLVLFGWGQRNSVKSCPLLVLLRLLQIAIWGSAILGWACNIGQYEMIDARLSYYSDVRLNYNVTIDNLPIIMQYKDHNKRNWVEISDDSYLANTYYQSLSIDDYCDDGNDCDNNHRPSYYTAVPILKNNTIVAVMIKSLSYNRDAYYINAMHGFIQYDVSDLYDQIFSNLVRDLKVDHVRTPITLINLPIINFYPNPVHDVTMYEDERDGYRALLIKFLWIVFIPLVLEGLLYAWITWELLCKTDIQNKNKNRSHQLN
jgi:hypothetical protein